MHRSQVINFGAGPSALPDAVLHDAAKGLLNYNNTGIGITELSHRSKEFTALAANLESLIRQKLAVPPSHSILFTQGGGSAQFSAVALNLIARHRQLHPDRPTAKADYVLTGSWSQKALAEAQRLIGNTRTHVVVDARTQSLSKSFDHIPPHSVWSFSPAPAYIYYCENETVHGVQFSADPSASSAFPFALVPPDTPLIADISSSFLSRPVPNLSAHALLFAGAQKNLGPSGLTVLIIRNDLLVDTDSADPPVPLTLAYKTLADSHSLYNTPPMFPMYVAVLVLDKVHVPTMEAVNRRKMHMLYAALERAQKAGKVTIKVREGSRSWMNATFVVVPEEEEKRFLVEAEAHGFRQLKGHRSVGGIRVSLYNAITEEQVQRLVAYIDGFFSTQA